ncbi:helix-turn-helix domain-containing protein [Arthrobacter luteolus]|uniref:helix-turn-helix domain-containing protein n=1 Tax=Arthrobacter luteolus TaxID=98672 RepID=UPI0008298117|nr:helix-turn-helix domain-containing protein [Arthrobacter luteolus]
MKPDHDDCVLPSGERSGAHEVSSGSRRLLASWQRSQEYGVSAETVDPAWAGEIPDDSLFYQCGQEVLAGLQQSLANEPLSLMLTDADGLVLNRFSGDPALLRALDRVYLAPGFAYSERLAGTNGLGLALADKAPTLVRAEEHYSASLRTYTCAAAPVLDPVTGSLEGSVNITTWSKTSPGLLVALAQSAAANTSSLMSSRSHTRVQSAKPQGGVFRVQRPRLEPAAGTMRAMSAAWSAALDDATAALACGNVVAAVGEHGSGRATLLGQALRQARPASRILCASVPAPDMVEDWLALWTPELSKPDTAIIIENADFLPEWAAHELAGQVWNLLRASSPAAPAASAPALLWAFTAENLENIPSELTRLAARVVAVPALRDRPADVMPLARYAARQTRLRELDFTAAAERALTSHDWPGNVDELIQAVHAAALLTETIDVRHLPPDLLGRTAQRLTRMETFERDEIFRVLARPGTSVTEAAAELGISRATIYRRLAKLGIDPRNPRA